MPDKPMTRKQVEDLLEKQALIFTNVVRENLEEYGNKQKEEQRLARENTYEQGTGYSWENRDKVRGILHWADSAKKTSTLWRGSGIIVISGLVIEKIWEMLFNAGA